MKAHNFETQSSVTPAKALQFLKEGNERFINNLKLNRNLLQQVNETRDGQWPFAVILSCIDSRTSAELIFDQGMGDIFSIRIAGNVVNEDILGSMEFACKVKHSKLILVLGHTNCGAVSGAYNNVELGHLTHLISKMKIPVETVCRHLESEGEVVDYAELMDRIAKENVIHSISVILHESNILAEMFEMGEIDIVGGLYSTESGQVDFFHYAVPGAELSDEQVQLSA